MFYQKNYSLHILILFVNYLACLVDNLFGYYEYIGDGSASRIINFGIPNSKKILFLLVKCVDYTENSDSNGNAYSHNIITNYYGSGNWGVGNQIFCLNRDNTLTVGHSYEPIDANGICLRSNLQNKRYVVFVIFGS